MEFPQRFTHSATHDEAEDRLKAAQGIPGITVKKIEYQPDGLVVVETVVSNPTSLKSYNLRLRQNSAHPMSANDEK